MEIYAWNGAFSVIWIERTPLTTKEPANEILFKVSTPLTQLGNVIHYVIFLNSSSLSKYMSTTEYMSSIKHMSNMNMIPWI